MTINENKKQGQKAAADLNKTVKAFLMHQDKEYLIKVIHSLATPIIRPEATAEEVSIYSNARIMSAICDDLEIYLKGRES